MKKGFTLVELLGVILILGILAGIVTPSVDNTIKRNKQKLQDVQRKDIVANINNYLSMNVYTLGKYDDFVIYINLLDLANNGLGGYEYKDPVTGKYLDFYQNIAITKSNNEISFNLDNLYNSSYLLSTLSTTVCKTTTSNINLNKEDVIVKCNGINTEVSIIEESLTNNTLQKIFIPSISKYIYINNMEEL